MTPVHIAEKASPNLPAKLNARKVNSHLKIIEDQVADALLQSHYRLVQAWVGAGGTRAPCPRARVMSEQHVSITLRAGLATMTGDTTAGRLATMKDAGMMKAGQGRGAPVEVIMAVLEAGFGTICHLFNNLGHFCVKKRSGVAARV
jgi:hypothetical protein